MSRARVLLLVPLLVACSGSGVVDGGEADLEMLADDDRAAVLAHVARWAGVALDEPRSLSIELERDGRRAAMSRLRPASMLGARP